LSDDSGLVVPALSPELGIHSARFGGEGLTDLDRCRRLLEKLQGLERDAYFVCVLCFFIDPGEIYFFEGRAEGAIGDSLSGDEGFGYDPLFIPRHHPDGKTFAQDPLWKAKNSHRTQALAHALRFLEKSRCQTC